MGQAKQRGTYEQRKDAALAAKNPLHAPTKRLANWLRPGVAALVPILRKQK